MRKLFSRLLFVILPLLALLYSAVTLSVYWAYDDFLARNQLQGQLGNVLWQPRLGKVTITDARAKNSEGRGFQIDSLVLDLELMPLLDKRLVIEELTLIDGHLDSRFGIDDLEVGGVTLYTELPAEMPTEEIKGDSTALLGWSVDIQQLNFQRIGLCAQQRNKYSKILFDHCVRFDELQMQAALGVTSLEPLNLTFAGEMYLGDLSFNDLRANRRTLSFSRLSIDDLNFKDNAVQINKFALGDIAFAERTIESRQYQQYNYHARLGELALHELQVDFGGEDLQLAIDHIALAGLNLLLYRDTEVDLPIIRLIDGLIDEEMAAREQDAAHQVAPNSGTALSIGSIRLGDNSQIYLIDESIQPSLEQHLHEIELEIGALDNQQPTTKTPVKLDAKIGDFGRFNLAGWSKPFADKVNISLQGKLAAMDMLPYSPYSENAAGYKISRGQLDNTLDIKVDNDIIDANFDIFLRKFEVASLAEEEKTDASGETIMPLGLGLMLLQDSNGNVELDIPVSGDIADPNFSLASAFVLVGRKVVTQAVINYYTPYGLVNLGGMALGAATKMRFEPLLFAANSTAADDAEARLNSLSGLLAVKPQLSLVVCPNASAQDWQVLYGTPRGLSIADAKANLLPQERSALLALAKKRSQGIAALLLSGGAKPEQVLLCAPSLNLANTGKAQASIEM